MSAGLRIAGWLIMEAEVVAGNQTGVFFPGQP